MKITWIIFLTLGVLLILLNLPVLFIGGKTQDIPDAAGRIAYFIGRNIAFIVGAMFLLIAFFVNNRWRSNRQKRAYKKLIDSISVD